MSGVLATFCLNEKADRDCSVLPSSMEREKASSFDHQYDLIAKHANQRTIDSGSSAVTVKDLDDFKSFQNDASFSEDKQPIIDALILKMLSGDRVAHSIFLEVSDNIPDFSFSTMDQHFLDIHNHIQDQDFSGVSSSAMMQAVYWLESEGANSTSPDLVGWYHDCCFADLGADTDAGA